MGSTTPKTNTNTNCCLPTPWQECDRVIHMSEAHLNASNPVTGVLVYVDDGSEPGLYVGTADGWKCLAPKDSLPDVSGFATTAQVNTAVATQHHVVADIAAGLAAASPRDTFEIENGDCRRFFLVNADDNALELYPQAVIRQRDFDTFPDVTFSNVGTGSVSVVATASFVAECDGVAKIEGLIEGLVVHNNSTVVPGALDPANDSSVKARLVMDGVTRAAVNFEPYGQKRSTTTARMNPLNKFPVVKGQTYDLAIEILVETGADLTIDALFPRINVIEEAG